jgi:hypothetical protein
VKKLPEMPEPYYLVTDMLFGQPRLKLMRRHKLWFPTTEEWAFVYPPGYYANTELGTIDYYAGYWTRRIKREDELMNWYRGWQNG